MILEQLTYNSFGYYPKDLKPYSRKKVIACCEDCGKVKVVKIYRANSKCKSCANKGINNPNYGKKASNETRKKMSKAHKGRVSPMKGRTMSEENKEIKSKLFKMCWQDEDFRRNMIIKHSGESSPNWKGGITPLYRCIRNSKTYRKWRNKISERDNNSCRCCNSTHKLNVHHITPFLTLINSNNIRETTDGYLCEELWDTSNGITLCESCHNMLHRKYLRMSTKTERSEISIIYTD